MTDRNGFDGRGGAPGVGTGAAVPSPTPVEDRTPLDYDVTAMTDGTLARIGSRRMDRLAR